MIELTMNERKSVSGGILPILTAIGSLLTHGAVRSVGQYYLSRALFVSAVVTVAKDEGEKKRARKAAKKDK